VLSGVIATHLFDTSLRSPAIAAKVTGFPVLGVFPSMSAVKRKQVLLSKKAQDHVTRQILLKFNKKRVVNTPYLIGVLSDMLKKVKVLFVPL
jgi:hypothetical protein